MRALATGLCFALVAQGAIANPEQAMEVGDIWTFQDAPLTQSRIYIRKLEEDAAGNIAHISIYPIPYMMRPDGQKVGGIINHMPFDQDILSESLIQKDGSDLSLNEDFESGYQQWKDAEGGVFTVTPVEAINFVYEAFGATLPVIDSQSASKPNSLKN